MKPIGRFNPDLLFLLLLGPIKNYAAKICRSIFRKATTMSQFLQESDRCSDKGKETHNLEKNITKEKQSM